MSRSVMLDLETLSTEKNAAVIAIGAVIFNKNEIVKSFSANISIDDACKHGHVAGGTLAWWMRQPREALAIASSGVLTLKEALTQLDEFLNANLINCAKTPIWANSPSFDCEILKNAYSSIGMTYPFRYYMEKDYRTVKSLFPYDEITFAGVKHDAVSDAIHQTKQLMVIAKEHNLSI